MKRYFLVKQKSLNSNLYESVCYIDSHDLNHARITLTPIITELKTMNPNKEYAISNFEFPTKEFLL